MSYRNRVEARTAITVLCILMGSSAASAQSAIEHFEKRVRPLFIEKCVSCHGPNQQKGGLRLDSRSALLTGGGRGAAVVPSKPSESLLLRVLAHDGEVKMPPKKKLSTTEIAAVTEWVKSGAPWPKSDAIVASKQNAAPHNFTREELNYWAFQPVKLPVVPTIRDSKAPIRNDIDRFLLAKLQDNGLSFSPHADRRTLIRRVTFDLAGLPPTPAEIDAFLKDSSADAYEKLVERLLASTGYGEKWGRRWLDVARYSDSNGMDENLAYVNAWRYRDWVIKSFNSDKPYDAFVREQIAGDLMADGKEAERAERLIATGFLVIGPKMLAEDDPMKMRMDIIDEQLDTIGQTVMGVTLGCARCHDHKFDPLTAADYYGLAGIFYSTKTMKAFNVVATWNERALGTPQSIAALAEYEKKLATARTALTTAERKLKASATAKIAEERKRVAEYVAAAAEVCRRQGPLKLIVTDPSKKSLEGTILFESENFTKGNVLKLTDGYGEGIGVIINGGKLPNFAEYDVTIAKGSTYQLAVRYAAAQSRPVRILLDGKVVANDACGKQTGTWMPDSQAWAAEAVITLPPGKSVIRFERDGPFPHLDKFALIPTSTKEATTTPISLEGLAKERNLQASLLRQWLEAIEKREGKVPTGEELIKLADATEGPFRVSPAVESEIQVGTKVDVQNLRDQLAAIQKSKPAVEEVMAVEDSKAENLKIHLRGNHLTLGDEAPRRFPRIMADAANSTIGADRSGRREFAEWLTRPEHPLTARVMANRIWAGHFGVGLVRSPDNFGKLGERPTHPELLDWLASEFVQSNWSIKHMHRLIVTSTAYRMSSESEPAAMEKDPENRLYSHFNRRRLGAEEVRDGMLAISGLLDRTMGGSLLKANPRQYVTNTGSKQYDGYESTRRSVYLPIIRSGVYDVLQTLDFPDPSVPNGQRNTSTIPTQALFLLNSSLADKTSEALAASILGAKSENSDRIDEAYRRTLGRVPTTAETAKVLAYLTKSEAAADPKLSADERRLRAWRGLCRVLLASNEFIFVE